MARDAGYPDNLLEQDEMPSPYGGEGGRDFGGLAWDWLHGIIQTISKRILQHLRVDHDAHAPIVQDAVVVGDCIGVDLSRTASGRPWIGKMTSISANNAVFLGVALEGRTAGLRCRVAAHGLVDATVTGLIGTAVSAGKVDVSVNASTNKLKVAAVGEEVVGWSDTGGNVMLLAPGRLAAIV
jgi:hypothetical protein